MVADAKLRNYCESAKKVRENLTGIGKMLVPLCSKRDIYKEKTDYSFWDIVDDYCVKKIN